MKPENTFSDSFLFEHIQNYSINNTLKLRVKPYSSKNAILGWDEERGVLRVAIAAPPEDNNANKELVKFLSKTWKKKVQLVKGHTSRDKIVKFI
jgi:uncharacterized protein